MPDNVTALVLASLLVALSPGPGTALVIRQSTQGRTTAFFTVVGMEVGVACWTIAAVLGLSAVLTTSEIAYHVLQVAGALFLIYLGVKAWLAARKPHVTIQPTGKAFRSGLIVNLANPKLGVFAISFLPQFLPASGGSTGALLLCAGVCVAVDTAWYLVIVFMLDRFRLWLVKPKVRPILERLSGSVLIALGVRLAITAT